MNPQSGSGVEPRAVAKQEPTSGLPEAVRFMLLSFAAMIAGEFVHQVIVVVSALVDPSPLKERALEQAKSAGEELSESTLNLGVYGSIAVMATIQLVVIVLFVLALRALRYQAKWAPNARRLLQIFGVFFGLRMLTLFMMSPASSTVPIALYAGDGVVQILLGVAGVLGIVYSLDKESVAWAEAPLKGQGPRRGTGAGGGSTGGAERDEE